MALGLVTLDYVRFPVGHSCKICEKTENEAQTITNNCIAVANNKEHYL